MSRPVKQKDLCGCAIACVAFVLRISYDKAKKLFKNSDDYSKFRGFYCREVVQALQNGKVNYRYARISHKTKYLIRIDKTIVFTRRSKKYPFGHYLCRNNGKWIDPWVNFPNITDIKAGFRTKLPEKAIFVLFPAEQSIDKNLF